MFGDDDNPFSGKGSALGRLFSDKSFGNALRRLRDQGKEKGNVGAESDVDFFFQVLLEAKGKNENPNADSNQKWRDAILERRKSGIPDEEFLYSVLGTDKIEIVDQDDLGMGPAAFSRARRSILDELSYRAQNLLADEDYSAALLCFNDLAANDDWLKDNWEYLDSILPELMGHMRNVDDLAWIVMINHNLDRHRSKTTTLRDLDDASDGSSPSEGPSPVPGVLRGDPLHPVVPDDPAGKERRDHPPATSPHTADTERPAVASPATFELTPHLDVDRAEPLKAADRFSVTVRLDNTPAAKGETSDNVRVAAYSRVEVTFAASAHFRFEGSRTLEFIADPGKDRILLKPLIFVVADDVAALLNKEPFISAIFYVNNRSCGQVTRSIEIDGAKLQPAAEANENAVVIAPVGPDQADITITIAATPAKDGRSFICSVQAPKSKRFRERQTGDWVLESAARDLVKGIMDNFAKQRNAGSRLIAELKGAGKILFDASPELFQAAFWELLQEEIPVRTIAIVTAEPFIPWELMIPYRTKDGTYEEKEPLGVAYLIGRWIDGKVISPARDIRLHDSFVIAPTYIGNDELEHARDEVAMVLNHYDGDAIEPADFDTVEQKLGTTGRSLVHFVCHGKDAGNGIQSIPLERDSELTSYNLLGMEGLPAIFHTNRPVVFLNACKIGQMVPSLIGLGGFVVSFIKLGAIAVIAPLWSVDDATARVVARQFYQELKAEPSKPLAEILTSIRERAYKKQVVLDDNEELSNDTFAAYCFYGDPMAVLTASK